MSIIPISIHAKANCSITVYWMIPIKLWNIQVHVSVSCFSANLCIFSSPNTQSSKWTEAPPWGKVYVILNLIVAGVVISQWGVVIVQDQHLPTLLYPGDECNAGSCFKSWAGGSSFSVCLCSSHAQSNCLEPGVYCLPVHAGNQQQPFRFSSGQSLYSWTIYATASIGASCRGGKLQD